MSYLQYVRDYLTLIEFRFIFCDKVTDDLTIGSYYIYIYMYIVEGKRQFDLICLFPPTIYTSLYSYVLSTVLRKSKLLYIYIYIYNERDQSVRPEQCEEDQIDFKK